MTASLAADLRLPRADGYRPVPSPNRERKIGGHACQGLARKRLVLSDVEDAYRRDGVAALGYTGLTMKRGGKLPTRRYWTMATRDEPCSLVLGVRQSVDAVQHRRGAYSFPPKLEGGSENRRPKW
jgi:hypothetical protein